MIDLRDYASIQARRPLLVAHRGGVITPDAPENSLASIQLAATHGYDMVELDVREAKDSEPVLFHGLAGGSNLFVDCGIDLTLEDLTSEELVSICYRSSTEPIATLAQALALCESLNLGVMLDIKTSTPSEAFLQRIAGLVDAHQLGSATVTISHHSFVREYLGNQVLCPVTAQDFQCLNNGKTMALRGQYWFGWASKLPDATVELLQKNGAFVIAAINTFHYPAHAHYALAHQDAKRLLEAGVDGFQLDSVYRAFF